MAILNEKIYPILKSLFSKQKELKKNYTFKSAVYDNLTLKQLEGLPKQIPEVITEKDFFAALYVKGYGNQIQQYSKIPNLEASPEHLNHKRQYLTKVIKWLEDFKIPQVQSFIDQLIYEILNLDLLLRKPDLKLFSTYLKHPRSL